VTTRDAAFKGLGTLVLSLTAGTGTSCATTHHYVNKNIPNQVVLHDSPSHQFKYVNVTEDEDELVVYGKIYHTHVRCDQEGHVAFSVIGADHGFTYSASIPIVRRNSRMRGWYGAVFRARFPIRIHQYDRVRLEFRGEKCITEETFRRNEISRSARDDSDGRPEGSAAVRDDNEALPTKLDEQDGNAASGS